MENRFGTFGDNDRAKGTLFNERISEIGNELILEHNAHTADAGIHVTAEKKAEWDNLKTFQTAGGTGTSITLTGIELTNGYQKTFVISASNSGAATTINGKPLYKPGGTAAPNLTAGKAATVWYNLAGDCFFIKASAEGTAVAGDVLASKTFSNDDDTGAIGVMPNRGAVTITPGTANQAILDGYHNGSGYVAGDVDLVAANIKNGASIFGVGGVFSDFGASLSAGDTILHNKTNLVQTTNSTTYILNRGGYTANRSGAIRFVFDFAAAVGGYAKVYKNGSPVGSERYKTDSTYVTYSQDFSCNAGDVFAIYCKTASGGEAYTKNIKIGVLVSEYPITQGS